jgi:hypothetical protein
MATWNDVWTGIGQLGQTKQGMYTPLLDSHRNLNKAITEGLGGISNMLGRKADRKWQEKQTKEAKGYIDKEGIYHPGTDVMGEKSTLQAKTIEELKIMFPNIPEEQLQAYLDMQERIGGVQATIAGKTAGAEEDATFKTLWQKEGFNTIDEWMAYHKDDPPWKQYGFGSFDEWKDWQKDMAAIGIKVSDDDDNFLVKAGVYLRQLKEEHDTYFVDPKTGLGKGFLDMSPEDQTYLMEQWKAGVRSDPEATELIDWFAQKFKQPDMNINVTTDQTGKTEFGSWLETLRATEQAVAGPRASSHITYSEEEIDKNIADINAKTEAGEGIGVRERGTAILPAEANIYKTLMALSTDTRASDKGKEILAALGELRKVGTTPKLNQYEALVAELLQKISPTARTPMPITNEETETLPSWY